MIAPNQLESFNEFVSLTDTILPDLLMHLTKMTSLACRTHNCDW